MDDVADKLIPLHLYLECGASHATVLNLISLGLSRTTALLLKKQLTFPEHTTPENCRAILRKTDINSLELPAICKKEVRYFIGL